MFWLRVRRLWIPVEYTKNNNSTKICTTVLISRFLIKTMKIYCSIHKLRINSKCCLVVVFSSISRRVNITFFPNCLRHNRMCKNTTIRVRFSYYDQVCSQLLNFWMNKVIHSNWLMAEKVITTIIFCFIHTTSKFKIQ